MKTFLYNDIRSYLAGDLEWELRADFLLGRISPAPLWPGPNGSEKHYLRDVLTRLPAMTNQDDLDALTPANRKPA